MAVKSLVCGIEPRIQGVGHLPRAAGVTVGASVQLGRSRDEHRAGEQILGGSVPKILVQYVGPMHDTTFPSAPSCPGNLRHRRGGEPEPRCPFEATWSHLRTIVAITSAYCVAYQPSYANFLNAVWVKSRASTPPGDQEPKTNTSRSIDSCFT